MLGWLGKEKVGLWKPWRFAESGHPAPHLPKYGSSWTLLVTFRLQSFYTRGTCHRQSPNILGEPWSSCGHCGGRKITGFCVESNQDSSVIQPHLSAEWATPFPIGCAKKWSWSNVPRTTENRSRDRLLPGRYLISRLIITKRKRTNHSAATFC